MLYYNHNKTTKGGVNMNTKTVKAAAAARGIFFDGLKTWQNNVVGFGYFVFTPGGRGFIQADTLSGLYKRILEYPKIKRR